ncbi:MAG: DUF6131 family protein [Demequina sp.]
MILLGIILFVIGLLATIEILRIIGIILVVLGLIFVVLGALGRGIGGRKHYF